MFIFDQKFHGYYIHGQFPGDSSDVTLDKLKLALDAESLGNQNQRGLVDLMPGDQQLTTFEVFVSAKDRTYLDVIFKQESKEFALSKTKK